MMEPHVTVVLQVIIETQITTVLLARPTPTLIMQAQLLVKAAAQASTLFQDPLLAQIV